MKRIYPILILLFLLSTPASGQLLLPNQPEQDACKALLLCGNIFHTPYSYQGNGQKLDLSSSPCDIPGLNTGEDNAMWLRLEINTAGTIIFNITPVNIQDDYDWAVLNITNGNCNNLSPSQVIRCNFNRNLPVTNNGITGLNMTSTEIGVPGNTQGHSYCKYIDAQAGDVYLIMVNNFGFNGGPSSGFTIDFSSSTATFNNSGPPHLESILNHCNINQYALVQLNKPIKCSSIATNGSDFHISGGGGIISAEGINCSGSQGYTNKIKVHFATPLSPGQHVLHARTGTDNNTLLDLCDNELPLPDSLPFTVPILATTETRNICERQLPYRWHGQVINQGGNAIAQASFRTAMGCDSVVTLNLIVSDTLRATKIQTICPDQLPYTWHGHTINSGGTHVAQYYSLSISGCDSLTYLNLVIQYPHLRDYHLEGCGSIIFNNHTYAQSQTAQDTVISSFGCDSVYATLYLIVHPVDTSNQTVDTMGCGSVSYNGKTYDSSITLRDTIRNQYGCDSIYKVAHITVYPNKYVPHHYYYEGCGSVQFEGRTFHEDITLVDTFQNVLGCDSAIRFVNIHPEHFQLSLQANPDSPAEGVYIRLTTSANQQNYEIISWKPREMFPLQTAYEQEFKAGTPGHYTYEVVGQSEKGCLDTAKIQLTVDTLHPEVYIPSAFSPNGDGLNDVFRPYFINRSGYTISTFKIFNRYGQLVYRSDRSTNGGWNGRYNNGQTAESGVYYYYFIVKFVDGTTLNLKGDVTLIR